MIQNTAPTPRSTHKKVVTTVEEGLTLLDKIKFPVQLNPAYPLPHDPEVKIFQSGKQVKIPNWKGIQIVETPEEFERRLDELLLVSMSTEVQISWEG